jgi:hypothetical protein
LASVLASLRAPQHESLKISGARLQRELEHRQKLNSDSRVLQLQAQIDFANAANSIKNCAVDMPFNKACFCQFRRAIIRSTRSNA